MSFIYTLMRKGWNGYFCNKEPLHLKGNQLRHFTICNEKECLGVMFELF